MYTPTKLNRRKSFSDRFGLGSMSNIAGRRRKKLSQQPDTRVYNYNEETTDDKIENRIVQHIETTIQTDSQSITPELCGPKIDNSIFESEMGRAIRIIEGRFSKITAKW